MLLQKPFAAVFGAVTSILAMTSVAIADGSTKDAAPAPEAPKSPFTYSFNVGVTTDYVFRGYSQKREEPALQGGIDLTYAVRPDVSAYSEFGDPELISDPMSMDRGSSARNWTFTAASSRSGKKPPSTWVSFGTRILPQTTEVPLSTRYSSKTTSSLSLALPDCLLRFSRKSTS